MIRITCGRTKLENSTRLDRRLHLTRVTGFPTSKNQHSDKGVGYKKKQRSLQYINTKNSYQPTRVSSKGCVPFVFICLAMTRRKYQHPCSYSFIIFPGLSIFSLSCSFVCLLPFHYALWIYSVLLSLLFLLHNFVLFLWFLALILSLYINYHINITFPSTFSFHDPTLNIHLTFYRLSYTTPWPSLLMSFYSAILEWAAYALLSSLDNAV